MRDHKYKEKNIKFMWFGLSLHPRCIINVRSTMRKKQLQSVQENQIFLSPHTLSLISLIHTLSLTRIPLTYERLSIVL